MKKDAKHPCKICKEKIKPYSEISKMELSDTAHKNLSYFLKYYLVDELEGDNNGGRSK